jgi:hypothetical protein
LNKFTLPISSLSFSLEILLNELKKEINEKDIFFLDSVCKEAITKDFSDRGIFLKVMECVIEFLSSSIKIKIYNECKRLNKNENDIKQEELTGIVSQEFCIVKNCNLLEKLLEVVIDMHNAFPQPSNIQIEKVLVEGAFYDEEADKIKGWLGGHQSFFTYQEIYTLLHRCISSLLSTFPILIENKTYPQNQQIVRCSNLSLFHLIMKEFIEQSKTKREYESFICELEKVNISINENVIVMSLVLDNIYRPHIKQLLVGKINHFCFVCFLKVFFYVNKLSKTLIFDESKNLVCLGPSAIVIDTNNKKNILIWLY